MKVLLTGFEPFGKQKVNPSEVVTRALDKSGVEGIELSTAILAVDRVKAPDKLIHAFEEVRPDAVLMLGEAGGYPVPTIERVFINLMEYPAEFGGGVAVADEVLVPDGPGAYFATLPVRRCSERIIAAGIPCRMSLSAGSYICNQVGYVMHDYLRRKRQLARAGVIHLPFLPEQAVSPVAAWPSMSLEMLTKAVATALKAIAERKAEPA